MFRETQGMMMTSRASSICCDADKVLTIMRRCLHCGTRGTRLSRVDVEAVVMQMNTSIFEWRGTDNTTTIMITVYNYFKVRGICDGVIYIKIVLDWIVVRASTLL